MWTSLPTIGGHFAAVQGVAWEPRGAAFLLSVSSDQTTRFHAEWQRTQGEVHMGEMGGGGKVIIAPHFPSSEAVV